MTTTFKPRWEAPPEPRSKNRAGARSPGRIDREVEAMKKQPGRWMKVRESASGGAYRTYSNRGCETRTQSVAEGRYDIWARWNPGKEDTIGNAGAAES